MAMINDYFSRLEIYFISFLVGDAGVFLDYVFPRRLQFVAACEAVIREVCEGRLL
jgi:hypothetical protein